ncbi:hypothetical protein HU200_049850 [Digitaria exilis]|uniref:Response regulatory domain-containing protein n=1 Tax=Digitaria exilis TaxID=1010633 RepID=A0A835E848_9POAL|nr:hypothetical protein HU200_049850 [Digitaria exilis]
MDMDRYPTKLRVLAVDDDRSGLRLLKQQLHLCNYNNVTTVTDATTAWDMLRERKGRGDQFDMVISDIFMVDGGIDGFKLLEHVSLEMDIPVISKPLLKLCYLLSANDDKETMIKGIKNGACDYLVKPARLEQLRNIWMHVARNNMKNPRNKVRSGKDGGVHKLQSADGENSENGANHTKKYSKKNKMNEAVPMNILKEMNVDGLTRDCVASHLQKYRIYLRKLNDGMSIPESSQHQKELGRFEPPPPIVGASSSSDPFARMNSPSALGMHSVLPTQSAQHMSTQENLGIPLQQDTQPDAHGVNLPKDVVYGNSFTPILSGGLSSASQCFPSTGSCATSGSSWASISNDSLQLGTSMRIPSSSRTSYASLLRGKMVDASRGIPFDVDNFFEEVMPAHPSHVPLQSRELVIQPSVDQIQSSSAGLSNQLAPSNHLPLQPPELVHQPSIQFQSSPIGQFNQVASESHHLAGNSNSSSSRRIGVPSRYSDIGHIAGMSISPTQRNKIIMNQASRPVRSSDQVSTFGKDYHNQMSGFMGTTTPMVGFSEQTTINSGSSTSYSVMPIGTLPNFLIDNSVMPNHMPNGGGVIGILPEDGTDFLSDGEAFFYGDLVFAP